MIRFNSREDIIALTPLWKGERFPDGRPRVPDKYLQEMRKMTLEELWKPIFVKGYESQFEGDLKTLHDDGRKLIGRAVTATFVPTRPDLHEVMFGVGAAEGRKGNYNQWVIDSLVDGDVVVVDMYDKIYKGTFLGGNLTTAIKTRTKTGGVCCGGGMYWNVERLKRIPVKVFHGAKDDAVYLSESVNMTEAINRAGGRAELTVFPDCAHNCWDKVYSDAETYRFLCEKRKD